MTPSDRSTYMKAWRAARTPEQKAHDYALQRAWAERNREIVVPRQQAQQRKDYARARAAALAALGGQCVVCGLADPDVLDVDHIHGGGTAERRAIGSIGIHRKIVREGTEGYQLLCGNCHKRKTRVSNA